MRLRPVWLLGPVLALCVACKKEPPPPASETPSAAVPEAPPPVASVAALPAQIPVAPTEEDFEDEATQSITSKNLDQELDKLEKEIEKP